MSFNKTPSKRGDIRENVLFGLLFGRISVSKPPINILHKSVDELCDIVDKLMPIDSPVSMICDEGVVPTKLHMDNVSRAVTYIAAPNDLKEFRASENIPMEINLNDLSDFSESQFEEASVKVTSTPRKAS